MSPELRYQISADPVATAPWLVCKLALGLIKAEVLFRVFEKVVELLSMSLPSLFTVKLMVSSSRMRASRLTDALEFSPVLKASPLFKRTFSVTKRGLSVTSSITTSPSQHKRRIVEAPQLSQNAVPAEAQKCFDHASEQSADPHSFIQKNSTYA